MESWAYESTPTPVLGFLPSLLTTKTNRPLDRAFSNRHPGTSHVLHDQCIVGMVNDRVITPATPRERAAESVCRSAKRVHDDIAHLRKPRIPDVLKLIQEMDLLIPSA